MDHWPDASLVNRFLFEQWWPAVLLFGGLGLVLAFHALRRRSRALGLIAGACCAAAIVVTVVEHMVETPREQIMAGTVELADAAIGPFDVDRLEAILAEDVTFDVPRGNPVFEGRQAVVDLANRADQRYTFERWSLSGVDAAKTGPNVGESVTGMSARLSTKGGNAADSIFSGSDFGVPSQWQIEWRREGGRWLVSKIIMVKLAGVDATAGQLP
jgi:hypothetical protein